MASQFAAGLFLFSKIELVTLGHLLNKKKRNPKIIYRPALKNLIKCLIPNNYIFIFNY